MAVIELGGKERTLRYDYNALADLEERAGLSIQALLDDQRLGLATVRAILWAGLRHRDKGLTPAQVGIWLQQYMTSGGDLQALMDAVQRALEESGLFKAAGADDEGNG